MSGLCACAVFRSAPDMWAIQQLFPVMPIHRLDEQPIVSAVLADLTCGECSSRALTRRTMRHLGFFAGRSYWHIPENYIQFLE